MLARPSTTAKGRPVTPADKINGLSVLETPSHPCIAKTASGKPCSLKTKKYGRMCWIHTVNKLDLKVKKSGIEGAGDGLFAWDEVKGLKRQPVFDTGEAIDWYTGEVMTKEQIDALAPGDTLVHYAVATEDNPALYVNAWLTNDEVSRYANDPVNKSKYNAKLVGRVRTEFPENKLRIEATCPIFHGSEIFLDYGSEYRSSFPGKLVSLASRPPVKLTVKPPLAFPSIGSFL